MSDLEVQLTASIAVAQMRKELKVARDYISRLEQQLDVLRRELDRNMAYGNTSADRPMLLRLQAG
jgi:uncharacterized membrane protein